MGQEALQILVSEIRDVLQISKILERQWTKTSVSPMPRPLGNRPCRSLPAPVARDGASAECNLKRNKADSSQRWEHASRGFRDATSSRFPQLEAVAARGLDENQPRGRCLGCDNKKVWEKRSMSLILTWGIVISNESEKERLPPGNQRALSIPKHRIGGRNL